MRIVFLGVIAFISLFHKAESRAAIIDSTRVGFTIRHVDTLPSDTRVLYDIFCKEVDKWWDSGHTWSGDAANLYIQSYQGGCFGERWDNGRTVRHLNVIYTDPGKMIRMEGGLGPLQQFAVNGIMTLELKRVGAASVVSLSYTVGGYIPGGASGYAAMVDRVIGEQFKRYVEYAKKKN